LEQKAVNTIRFLAVDAIQKANSGHPGMPMGCADFAYVLWMRFLRFNPADPDWPDRDRFVLSAGHGSMLLYAMLHLLGYDVSMDDLKNFRQLGSKTPGHPEYWCIPGVEVTTGPLGQGFANGVGMAIAAKHLGSIFNVGGRKIMNPRIFAICSDGDLMEGVASEAASLAGHLRLGNIIYFYDDNRISIDGSTELTFTEDRAKRFEAYGWHVQSVDGHDRAAIEKAFEAAIAETERPSIIMGRTHIAFGSPNKQDKSSSHGAPLGEDEVKAAKENLGWPVEPAFHVPEEVRSLFDSKIEELKPAYESWWKNFEEFREAKPELAKLWDTMYGKAFPEDLEEQLLTVVPEGEVATRKASGKILQTAAELVPSLLGGSADLTPSNNTFLNDHKVFQKETPDGRNFHFGVREHAMGAILNGMSLLGGVIPYCGTFLMFADYMRPAIRMAALSCIQAIYVFTHDSVFLGEDGPTHQPVEHLASLRAMPNLTVIRPADGPETAHAWAYALRRKDGPTALVLTRQKLPVINRSICASAEGLLKGAYILADCEGAPGTVLVASGSEVSLALAVKEKLDTRGEKVRVVSIPSWEFFEQQDEEYRNRVIPPDCPERVAIEAGASFGWERYVGQGGLVIGIDRFGISAPYKDIAREFGFTPDAVVERILSHRS
jgi:transketolase